MEAANQSEVYCDGLVMHFEVKAVCKLMAKTEASPVREFKLSSDQGLGDQFQSLRLEGDGKMPAELRLTTCPLELRPLWHVISRKERQTG